MTSYTDILARLRRAFPSPVADNEHDEVFYRNITNALRTLDARKSGNPILGESITLDFTAARQATINPHDLDLEAVKDALLPYCEGLMMPIHPHTQRNIVPPPSMPSLLAVLLAALHNPSVGWDEYSQRISLAEVEVCAMLARLIGYDAQRSGGLFTFSGTGTNLYGMRVGLSKAIPTVSATGLKEDAVIVGSAASHYCRYNIASWLGIGTDNVITVGSDASNAMCLDELRTALEAQLRAGKKIAGIIATMGTTDAFGIDDLAAIVALRDELCAAFKLPYPIHVHADAVIGWAWSVFNNYDFSRNPLAFPPQTAAQLQTIQHALSALQLADSVGFDVHKSGFTPIIASAVLFKEQADLERLARSPQQMPYLFQYGDYTPGRYSLEATRSGTGVMAALANLRFFGESGLQTLLAHLLDIARITRNQLATQAGAVILNDANVGPVTVFRLYPEDKDAAQQYHAERNDIAYADQLSRHNDYNRAVFMALRDEVLAGNNGVILSFTSCYQLSSYGKPMLGLKSFIMSPFSDESSVALLLEKINAARQKI